MTLLQKGIFMSINLKRIKRNGDQQEINIKNNYLSVEIELKEISKKDNQLKKIRGFINKGDIDKVIAFLEAAKEHKIAYG